MRQLIELVVLALLICLLHINVPVLAEVQAALATFDEQTTTLGDDMQEHRRIQRECMDRVPVHSFRTTRIPGGYEVECKVIRK